MIGLLGKLAYANLVSNRRLYFPFALATVFSSAIFYVFCEAYAQYLALEMNLPKYLVPVCSPYLPVVLFFEVLEFAFVRKNQAI